MASDLTPLRICWLVLALIGAVLGLRSGGPESSELIAMVTLSIWCFVETMVRRNWIALATLPAMLLGLGFALPLYLFIRSRRIV